MPDSLPEIAQDAASAEFRQYLVDALVELCAVDTTPRADPAAAAAAEARVFDAIERRVKEFALPGLGLRRAPIDPAIERHPFYSLPYYSAGPGHPRGLPAAQAYAGRCNLVAAVDAAGGRDTGGLALNAHVDVVKPYIPPRVEGAAVFGRGACDDKGPAVAVVGALKLVARHLARTGLRLARPLSAMFVIDEEIGGNGSLSLAIDRELRKRYNTLVVMECCSSNIYPANRGAVWYRVDGRLGGMNLFEASAFIVDELEREGRAIKAESRHPLFPHRPVQTCHGVIGSFGEHPSRICGKVEFELRAVDRACDLSGAAALVRDLLDEAIARYTAIYGDKTQAIDPATGKPKVDHHYDLEVKGKDLFVRVHGSTGHMGAILQNDGAITKMAAMVRALVSSRSAISKAAGGMVLINLSGWKDPSHLVMEGGQGFLPTHDLEQVTRRMKAAVLRGARRYVDVIGLTDLDPAMAEITEADFKVTFDKLHNAAFAGDPDSPAMRDAIAAARAAGIWNDRPVLGWDVSCDARIFAREYPDDLSVITTGPGHLAHAHADNEQIDIDELVQFAGFLAQFILRQTL